MYSRAVSLPRRQGDWRRDQRGLLAFEALTTGFRAPKLEARHGQAGENHQADQQQAYDTTLERENRHWRTLGPARGPMRSLVR